MRHEFCKSIIRGGWQLTPGHLVKDSSPDGLAIVQDAIDKGFRVFDCADIYGGVEELFGQARTRTPAGGAPIRIHTKFVPDADRLRGIDFAGTQEIIDRSLRRLGTDSLDLVQFHWWDLAVPRHLEVLGYLFRLRSAGKIEAVGLTNFDGPQLRETLDAGFDIASIQVQYSLIDRRCESTLLPLARSRGVKVYTYGSLLGGFLDERWLDLPEPGASELKTRSLIKYKLIIDDWGGWGRYQSLLRQLSEVARRSDRTIAQVAVGAMLGSGRVDAVIVGLGRHNYQARNAELADISSLGAEDLSMLWSWDCPLEGDVYHLERTSERHARIMKYNLNRQAGAAPGSGSSR